MVAMITSVGSAKAQQMKTMHQSLSAKEKSIVLISSFTAQGKLSDLKTELNLGLESGLTINEIKEVLVHCYAYCGFPRSIRGLQTFMTVLEERKAKGMIDQAGKEAAQIKEKDSKYDRGKKILATLTQTTPPDKLTGYSAFAPTIDRFLKEHLFADIFERDVLSYVQRELVTISVISAIGHAEPMLQSHLGISLNVGISPEQLQEFIVVIAPSIGKVKAKAAQNVLKGVLKSNM